MEEGAIEAARQIELLSWDCLADKQTTSVPVTVRSDRTFGSFNSLCWQESFIALVSNISGFDSSTGSLEG
jgi:hypothetical protein